MPDPQQAQNPTPVAVPPDAVSGPAEANTVAVPQDAVSAPAQKPSMMETAYRYSGLEGLSHVLEHTLSHAGLPTSLANIPDWAKHLVGAEEDPKPWWDDIHIAAKDPSLENLVRAVPIFGPSGADAAKDFREKDYLGAIGDMFGPEAAVFASKGIAKETGPAAKAIKEHITNAARVRAALPKVEGVADLNSAIPATKTAPYTPKDVNAALPHILAEHAEGPIKTVEGFRDAADSAIGKIEERVDGYIKTVPKDPIATDVLSDVQKVLGANPRGQAFVDAGLRELEGLNLKNPTLEEADGIRRQLNFENKAVLKANDYDLAAARASSPAFAAREAAAESLRNGIYDQLEARGIEGVRELRQTEGSIIKLRNAAQGNIFKGEKVVGATAKTGPLREAGAAATRTLATGAGAGIGAAVGGPVGAAVGGAGGAAVGDAAAKVFTPSGLTRDQLVERAFTKLGVAKVPGPEFPRVNLRAVPEKQPPVGTQGDLPLGPSNLFDETNPSVTGEKPVVDTPTRPGLPEEQGPPAAQAIDRPIPQGTSVEVEHGTGKPAENQPDLVKRLGPLAPAGAVKVLNDPLATAAQKAAAKKQLQKVAADLEKRNQTGAGVPPLKPNMVRFKASDGSLHDVPRDKINEAKQIDPGLKVIE